MDIDVSVIDKEPVRCEELVVVQFDDVSVLVCNHLGNAYQLAWFIRQKNGYSKDTVSLDQSVLDHGRHGDDVHISAA